MANYNNFGGYNGFSYPYGMPYQPIMPQTQQPNFNNMGNMMNNQNQQQAQPQANSYFYVNGIIGAKSFQLQPNQTVMLMDSDSPMCYMKQSNGMGQSTLRYFKLVEVSENDLNNTNESKQQDTSEYVLKSDFEVLSRRLDDLSKKIEKPYKSQQNNDKGVKSNEQ